MREIRRGLRARADAVALGHGAVAEAAQLREDEPHPVAALATRGELGAHLRPDRRLRGDEALELVRVGDIHHEARPSCAQSLALKLVARMMRAQRSVSSRMVLTRASGPSPTGYMPATSSC
jgi:hypothetical protein